MKDFDIEKLKRENIFIAKDDFFEKMQATVLEKTTFKTEAKIFNLEWVYAAAAAIAMIFGLTFFINSENTEKNTVTIETAYTEQNVATNSFSGNTIEKQDNFIPKNKQEDLTSTVQNDPRRNSEPQVKPKERTANFADQKAVFKTVNPERQVDQILAGFTSSDLSNLGKNTEQDIYLDLYN
jgi:hypothetical protein